MLEIPIPDCLRWCVCEREQDQLSSSLSDLKEIGCKSAWAVHISPLFWSIERLLTCKTGKICPRPAEFSLRFFKSDRLLGNNSTRMAE